MSDKPTLTKELIKRNFPIVYESTPERYERLIAEFIRDYARIDFDEAKAMILEACIERALESDKDWL